MKESVVTGQRIFEEMDKLYKELKDLNKGITAVNEELGSGSIAYHILRKNYEEVENKLNELKRAKYTKFQEGDDPFNG